MKIIITLLLVFSNFCFAQTQAPSKNQLAGACGGYHVFWAALSASSGKSSNMQCSVDTLKKLNNSYGNNSDYNEYRTHTNTVMVEAFKRNNPSLVKDAADVCKQIGITTCNLQ